MQNLLLIGIVLLLLAIVIYVSGFFQILMFFVMMLGFGLFGIICIGYWIYLERQNTSGSGGV